MLLRIVELIWYTVHILILGIVIVVPTYELGIVGFFIGLGVASSFILMFALISATFNYVVWGVFSVDDSGSKKVSRNG